MHVSLWPLTVLPCALRLVPVNWNTPRFKPVQFASQSIAKATWLFAIETQTGA